MIAFRHVDPRYPFLWETAAQSEGRWHSDGEGPVHYFADTPDGAWAELLRHEAIRDPADLATVRRAIWALDLPDERSHEPALSEAVMTGDAASYPACRAEARRLRGRGATRLEAPSAALRPGAAGGQRVQGGRLVDGSARDGKVFVLFGSRPDLVGWRAAAEGRPDERLLARVRHL